MQTAVQAEPNFTARRQQNSDHEAQSPVSPPRTNNWSGGFGSHQAGGSSEASATSRPSNNRVDPLPVLKIPKFQGYDCNYGDLDYNASAAPPPLYEDVMGNDQFVPPRPASASPVGMHTLDEVNKNYKFSAK